MTIGTAPQLATELCKIPYRLRKCSFGAVVRTAKMLKDNELLEHMLECGECREAILKRTPNFSKERMDKVLTLAIESVKRMQKNVPGGH